MWRSIALKKFQNEVDPSSSFLSEEIREESLDVANSGSRFSSHLKLDREELTGSFKNVAGNYFSLFSLGQLNISCKGGGTCPYSYT